MYSAGRRRRHGVSASTSVDANSETETQKLFTTEFTENTEQQK
jgi:hypothetical protein